MFHVISLLLHQCQRCKTQQQAEENSMFCALDLNCRFTEQPLVIILSWARWTKNEEELQKSHGMGKLSILDTVC